MKVSISLPIEDLEYVDAQTAAGVFPTRSAAVHAALRLLRDREHVDSYARAWDEWDAGDGAAWDALVGDGIR